MKTKRQTGLSNSSCTACGSQLETYSLAISNGALDEWYRGHYFINPPTPKYLFLTPGGKRGSDWLSMSYQQLSEVLLGLLCETRSAVAQYNLTALLFDLSFVSGDGWTVPIRKLAALLKCTSPLDPNQALTLACLRDDNPILFALLLR